jgi:hypothetical protein
MPKVPFVAPRADVKDLPQQPTTVQPQPQQ